MSVFFVTIMYCLQSALEGKSQGERHIWDTLQLWKLDILTYLCIFARWEHRPSTKERHRFLSVAILSISLLVYPISFVSFSVSLCQVFRGLPLPWGVPCDGLTGDCFWWFPECMSYPPPFSLLYFIFYG